MQCDTYWIFRYTFISISCFFTVFTTVLILVERLYRYLSCKLILLMNISFFVVMVAALLWTQQFTGGICNTKGQSYDPDSVSQPWVGLCKFEAWVIHSFWLAGFALSVLLNLAIMKALQGDAEFLLKWQKKLIGLCFLVPMLIMCIPFIYNGYGPSGFNVVYSNNQAYFTFLFCGWKYQENEMFNIAAFFNNTLPTMALCIISFAMYLAINIRKRRLQRQQVEFTNKQKLIIRTAVIPFVMMIVWSINVVLRMINTSNISLGWHWFFMILNTAFDLLPALECIMFLVYISYSVPLRYFHFLSCASTQHNSLLASSDGESEDYNH